MKPRKKRLLFIVGALACLAVVVALVLNAFRSNLVFFYTPTEVAQNKVPVGQYFRIGGLVKEGSVHHVGNGVKVRFVITDTARAVPVIYKGILPDLFTEGEGVVAEGVMLPNGTFKAKQVLAKHDANYMPPEAAKALKEARANKTAKALPVAAGSET